MKRNRELNNTAGFRILFFTFSIIELPNLHSEASALRLIFVSEGKTVLTF